MIATFHFSCFPPTAAAAAVVILRVVVGVGEKARARPRRRGGRSGDFELKKEGRGRREERKDGRGRKKKASVLGKKQSATRRAAESGATRVKRGGLCAWPGRQTLSRPFSCLDFGQGALSLRMLQGGVNGDGEPGSQRSRRENRANKDLSRRSRGHKSLQGIYQKKKE